MWLLDVIRSAWGWISLMLAILGAVLVPFAVDRLLARRKSEFGFWLGLGGILFLPAFIHPLSEFEAWLFVADLPVVAGVIAYRRFRPMPERAEAQSVYDLLLSACTRRGVVGCRVSVRPTSAAASAEVWLETWSSDSLLRRTRRFLLGSGACGWCVVEQSLLQLGDTADAEHLRMLLQSGEVPILVVQHESARQPRVRVATGRHGIPPRGCKRHTP